MTDTSNDKRVSDEDVQAARSALLAELDGSKDVSVSYPTLYAELSYAVRKYLLAAELLERRSTKQVTEADRHLGNVLAILAELAPEDTPKAVSSALAWFNDNHPTWKIEPVQGWVSRLVTTGPLDRDPSAASLPQLDKGTTEPVRRFDLHGFPDPNGPFVMLADMNGFAEGVEAAAKVAEAAKLKWREASRAFGDEIGGSSMLRYSLAADEIAAAIRAIRGTNE